MAFAPKVGLPASRFIVDLEAGTVTSLAGLRVGVLRDVRIQREYEGGSGCVSRIVDNVELGVDFQDGRTVDIEAAMHRPEKRR